MFFISSICGQNTENILKSKLEEGFNSGVYKVYNNSELMLLRG